MISIVGNIKINDLQRLKYLKATLWSFELLKEYQLLLNIDCNCITLDEITTEVEKIGFKNYQLSNESGNYGEIYCKLLDLVKSDYVINFFEDAFLLVFYSSCLSATTDFIRLNNSIFFFSFTKKIYHCRGHV